MYFLHFLQENLRLFSGALTTQQKFASYPSSTSGIRGNSLNMRTAFYNFNGSRKHRIRTCHPAIFTTSSFLFCLLQRTMKYIHLHYCFHHSLLRQSTDHQATTCSDCLKIEITPNQRKYVVGGGSERQFIHSVSQSQVLRGQNLESTDHAALRVLMFYSFLLAIFSWIKCPTSSTRKSATIMVIYIVIPLVINMNLYVLCSFFFVFSPFSPHRYYNYVLLTHHSRQERGKGLWRAHPWWIWLVKNKENTTRRGAPNDLSIWWPALNPL